jgi:ribose-phosphate pyrophosphokinase
MVRVNLTDGYKPFGEGLPVKIFTFPSGMEPHIKITRPDTTLNPISDVDFLITIRVSSASDIILLMLAHDALVRMGAKHISLFMPFLPFARQDRVMVQGEPFSLKVLTNVLNSMNFDRIMLHDVHSDISTALLDRSVSFSNMHLIAKAVENMADDYIIVSPDAGAQKKIYKVVEHLAKRPAAVLCATKSRDLASGQILSLTIPEYDYKGKDVVIVDDICDGGATFMPIAQALLQQGVSGTHLVVTHGIFSTSAPFTPRTVFVMLHLTYLSTSSNPHGLLLR